MALELLLDSADIQVWNQWMQSGLFTGITTNPTLLKKAGCDCSFESLSCLAERAEQLGSRVLHLQSWGDTAQEMTDNGKRLAGFSTASLKIYVKLPVTLAGSAAAKALVGEGVEVTFTACFEVEQVLIAASIGASYIAPYLGRINDQGRDGYSELLAMQACLKGIDSNCRLLVASIRDKKVLPRLAAAGLQTFTITGELAENLFNVRATLEASSRFEEDAH